MNSKRSVRSLISLRIKPGNIQILLAVMAGMCLWGCTTGEIKILEDVFQRPTETTIEEEQPPVESTSGWHRNITATYFDITEYSKPQTAWNDMDALEENPYYLALPMNNRVPGYGQYGTCKNRWVEIYCVDSGKTVYGQWEDVGPWFVNDAAYVFDSSGTIRPFAEQHEGQYWNIYREDEGKGSRKPRKVLNAAGIDLSPLLAQAAGIDGKGLVHWRFVDAADVPKGPWREKVSTSSAHYRQRFFMLFGVEHKHWELTTTRENR